MACKKDRLRQDLSNDLTLYDYANSVRPQKSSRIKKAAGNVNREAQQMSGLELKDLNLKDDASWFEKDLEDFEIPEREVEIETEPASLTSCPKGKCLKSKTTDSDVKSGIAYPADLWYTLANYIPPECIHRFSVLCKDAYQATRKKAFWRNIYNRYYNKAADLPEDLKPQAMERNHGLRARCVRALIFFVPVLMEKVKVLQPLDTDPHSLIGYRCLLVWHQPCQGRWHFCFKLQKPSFQLNSSSTRPPRQEDIRNGYNDLFYNPEDGCCVLQVTTTDFASTSPGVMGQLLSAVHLSLSHNFRNHRLRLSFDSNRVAENSASFGHAVETVLDPALAIRIFHWWDPSYPFPT